MKLKKILLASMAAALAVMSCGRFESVNGDPMGTKIYTLDNGLKVYMTVNKETPRIQTCIAIRNGGKNDPADNTGLAHYLEHIMFKGTERLGTSDYNAEKPLLDSIEALYNVYRTKTDKEEREAIYMKIDSLSYEASKISIPNEYDKAMSLISAEGTNAFTSTDMTCYVEDIPSNRIDTWAMVEADRFKNMVVRGFHTELEAVYEEKNTSMCNDDEKVFTAVDSMLYLNHPYGLQTVLGTQEHLKNPSITAIKKQKETYYVPNNCAICVSGDFDPKEFVKIIEKYFGDWKANENLPAWSFEPETNIESPREKDIYGPEAENVMIGWRYPGAATKDGEISIIVRSILNNGMAGLIDLNVNQAQTAIDAWAYNYNRPDYGEMLIGAYPKDGQTLKDVRDVLLAEVEKLRNGNFDESLIDATINNYKLMEMKSLEKNRARAMKFVTSFINREDWSYTVGRPERLSKLNKQDIMDWAGKYLSDNSYVVAYKHIGEDKSIKKIQAPAITPIATNREMESSFLTEVRNAEVKPIEPVFTDFNRDMETSSSKGLEILYKQNNLNDIATVVFRYDMGLADDPALGLAFDYAEYLGTPTMTADEIASRMYALACSFNTKVSDNTMSIRISGLSENIGEALDIVSDLYANAVADETILNTLKADEIKRRSDSKMIQSSCFDALLKYVLYGPEYLKKTVMTNTALTGLESGELLEKVRGMAGKQHKVLYYGPMTSGEFAAMLEAHHKTGGEPTPLKKTELPKARSTEPIIYIADYKAPQFDYIQFSNRGEKFDVNAAPEVEIFNQYFGYGMNSIVFQEMREARALAYSAAAALLSPEDLDDTYSFYASISSQNDKLKKAIEAFDLIINKMPQSQKAFDVAKSSLISGLRTKRVTGMSVLYNYLETKDLGLNKPTDELVFEKAASMTLEDVVAIQEKWVKDRTYIYGILGNTKELDMNYLKSIGKVKAVSLDELFGY